MVPAGQRLYHVNRLKRRNPPCAAPPLSSFPVGKKLDTTQKGAPQGGFLLLSLFNRKILAIDEFEKSSAFSLRIADKNGCISQLLV